jgi:uncharacterized protein (TIGR00369 family)
MFALSGTELLQWWREGRGPMPPIGYLTEVLLSDGSRGHTSFSMPTSPWFANGAGLIPGGMLAVLADAPLGFSIHTDLPPATPYTTAEISMTFLRPVRPDPSHSSPRGNIIGSGQVIHRGRSVALSEAFLIHEKTEQLVAHATSRCAILPQLDPVPEPPERLPAGTQPWPGDSPNDPLNQDLQGEFVPEDVFAAKPGLEVLRMYLAGELPPPPIFHLTGLTLREAGEGEATMTLPCTPWLSTAMRTVQGGFTAMLADAAQVAAFYTTTEAGTAIATLDLKVNLLRPVFPDGRDLTARATVAHKGRTVAIATARVENADGKAVALATGSAMYLPDRPLDLHGVDFEAAEAEAKAAESQT